MKDFHELEIYSPIEGFPNYLVTSHGRVLSLKDSKGKERIKELKYSNDKDGYYKITLINNGKGYNKRVHRLVAQSFIPNHDNKPQVNHIDEDKTNNQVSNLEWVTSKENINHGTRTKRAIKHKYRKIIGISITNTKILIFKSIRQAEKYGFDEGTISKCCTGERKQHKGYKWYYADEYFNKTEVKDNE